MLVLLRIFSVNLCLRLPDIVQESVVFFVIFSGLIAWELQVLGPF